MDPCSEVLALAAHALEDLERRGQLSLQWQLTVELAPQQHKEQFYQLQHLNTTNTPYRVTTSLIMQYFHTTCGVGSPIRFGMLCRLGMTQYLLRYQTSDSERIKIGIRWAARGGHLELVQMLLSWDDDPARRITYVDTALEGAAAGGHLDLIRYLLRLPHRRSNIYFAQQAAVKAGRQEVLEILVPRDETYVEFLMWDAALSGQMDILNLLLSKFKYPPRDWSNLRRVSSPAAVRLLISKFKPRVTSGKLKSMVVNAIRQGDRGLVETLNLPAGKYSRIPNLGVAVGEGGNMDFLRTLPIWMGDEFHLQLLEGACMGGHLNMIQYALQKLGQSPYRRGMRESILYNQPEALRMLLNSRRWFCEDLSSHLKLAAKYGRIEMVRMLLMAGAEPTQKAAQAALPVYPEVASLLRRQPF